MLKKYKVKGVRVFVVGLK